MESDFDVIIIGAGPAGMACALHLARRGVRIAILEQDSFPRHKVCGDGMTGYTLFELNALGPAALDGFFNLPGLYKVRGIRMYSPSIKHIDFYGLFKNRFGDALFHTCRRYEFDNYLYQLLKQNSHITVLDNFKVSEVGIGENGVWAGNGKRKISGLLLADAGGPRSIVHRQLMPGKPQWKHCWITSRCYYGHVEPLGHPDKAEVHYLKETLPGGLWLFPMKNGIYNIGLGLIAAQARKSKINTKTLLSEVLKKYPHLSKRFEKAEQLADIRSGIIPVGSVRIRRSGRRFLLLGDAAYLANPATGEGIGNAMNSGRIAADVIYEALLQQDFSKTMLASYDRAIQNKFRYFARRSYLVQKLLKHPGFINRLIKNYNRNTRLQAMVENIIQNPRGYKKMYNPLLYFRLFAG